MKKILATLLAVSLTFGSAALPAAESGVFLKGVTISASAEETDDGLVYYELDDGTLEIVGYYGGKENVVIPSKIDGKKVTSIGRSAFYNRQNIVSITIPDSVTRIGDVAFGYCKRLTSIALPTGVTSIGNSAFECCENLTSITIPNSVTSIGYKAFYDCTSLTSVTIPDSVTSIGDYAFNTCTSLTSITIPNSVTSIGEDAFYKCTSLTSITIPNSVTSIGDTAFYNCISLTSITIPNSVTSIGDYAFGYCTSLTSITIPNSVTSIGDYAFSDCTSLTSITIPNSVTSIGDSAFSDCTSLTSITIPNSVTSIGDWAFYECTSLTSITIPNSVTSIGYDAFYDTPWLKAQQEKNPLVIVNGILIDGTAASGNVVIPNSVTSIGDYAFSDCTSLTSITIPNSVTSIGYKAFYDCTSLTSITIPNSVTSIGSYAFEGTPWLKAMQNENPLVIVNDILIDGSTASGKVVIPNTVNKIADSAFKGIYSEASDQYESSITSITIPNSVTSIGDFVFSDCESLTSITIPNSVTSIGNDAFQNCTNLKSITIPNSVTSIGSGAFYNCTSLTSITIPNSVTSIGSAAFSWCRSLTSITIPNSVTSIGESAFYNCTSLTSITIPSSVTSIGSAAFYWCISLTDVYYTGSETEWNNIDIGENNTYLTNATIHYNYGSIHTHSYTSKITKAATCIATGVKTYTCSCGDTYTETIPATGHKSSGWIVDKAASIGVKGSKHKECAVCKKVLETAEIPALSRISISKASVTLSTSTYAYDGKAKKPGVTVKLNGKTLKNGTDYTVSYSNNTKVGTAKVTITGKGNYTGSISKTYSIKNDFKKATISGISTKAFTGKAITQKITVKANGKTLKSGTDYTVSYSNNKNVGTATVKIVGKGNYTGTISKTFKINPAKQEIQKLTAKSKAFFVDWAQKGSATGYEIQYATNSKFTSAKKVTITNNKTDTKTISKLSGKKKYYVRVRSYTTVKGTKYYGAWSATKTVTTKK